MRYPDEREIVKDVKGIYANVRKSIEDGNLDAKKSRGNWLYA